MNELNSTTDASGAPCYGCGGTGAQLDKRSGMNVPCPCCLGTGERPCKGVSWSLEDGSNYVSEF